MAPRCLRRNLYHLGIIRFILTAQGQANAMLTGEAYILIHAQALCAKTTIGGQYSRHTMAKQVFQQPAAPSHPSWKIGTTQETVPQEVGQQSVPFPRAINTALLSFSWQIQVDHPINHSTTFVQPWPDRCLVLPIYCYDIHHCRLFTRTSGALWPVMSST